MFNLLENASMCQVTKVRIDAIKIRKPAKDERSFNRTMATQLARSIEKDGQLQPILLRPHPDDDGFFEQIAGLHRIYAVGTVLKREFIDAYILECDEKSMEMKTIAENAFRNPLSKEQFYRSIAIWKKHYESTDEIAQPEEDNPLDAFETAAANLSDALSQAPIAIAAPFDVTCSDQDTQEGTQDAPGDANNGAEDESTSDAETPHQRAPRASRKKVAVDKAPFRTLVHETIGGSKSGADIAVRISDALELLSDDDRAIVFPKNAKEHAKRKDLIALCGLPEAMRPMAIALRAAGMPWDEAIDAQNAKILAAGTPVVAIKSENDLSDEEWLTMYAADALAKVTKKDVFTSDALVYRRFQVKIRRKIQMECNKFLVAMKADKSLKPGPYQAMITNLFRAKAPGDWISCGKCDGTGSRAGTNDPCPACRGAGYKLPIEPVA